MSVTVSQVSAAQEPRTLRKHLIRLSIETNTEFPADTFSHDRKAEPEYFRPTTAYVQIVQDGGSFEATQIQVVDRWTQQSCEFDSHSAGIWYHPDVTTVRKSALELARKS